MIPSSYNILEKYMMNPPPPLSGAASFHNIHVHHILESPVLQNSMVEIFIEILTIYQHIHVTYQSNMFNYHCLPFTATTKTSIPIYGAYLITDNVTPNLDGIFINSHIYCNVFYMPHYYDQNN